MTEAEALEGALEILSKRFQGVDGNFVVRGWRIR